MLPITFDPAKDERNRSWHGVSLIEAGRLDWATALVAQDTRKDYEEARMVAWGYIGERLYVCVYVDRPAEAPTVRRVISLRKANDRERTIYEQANHH